MSIPAMPAAQSRPVAKSRPAAQQTLTTASLAAQAYARQQTNANQQPGQNQRQHGGGARPSLSDGATIQTSNVMAATQVAVDILA
jgi:hypothetical protein